MKKFVSLLLAVITVLSCGFMATGCSSQSTVTEILLLNFDGGVGSEWLEADVAAFTELVKDKSYEEGKVGVKFRIDRTMGLSPSTMNTTGYSIYFDEAQTDIRALAANEYLIDLTDLVTTPLSEYGEERTIEDKIDSTYRSKLKGNDGKYYGLPYYEWYPGIVYDKDNFEKYNLYIADESVASGSVDTITRYGQPVRFLKNGRIVENRSCGNDGIKGTEDDGLPTTLVELMSMCQRMIDKGLTPFQTTGMHVSYTNYLLEALWASLAGYDKMRSCYTLSGEIEVVKRDAEDNMLFTNEPLFVGLVGKGNDGNGNLKEGNYIMKPQTEKITLNNENGYRTRDMVERYYATAFLEIAHREGWFTADSTTSSISHTDAQENFIFNGRQYGTSTKETCGMLIEGSYWYQESQRTGALDDYFNEEGKDKPMGWMSLPTALGVNDGESVTSQANKRDLALLETSQSFVTLNKASFNT